ncbi:hypothetical protein BDN70DRAFT_289230 [Pholiota conissans]|uniref:Uncharacterized protein n=1 Tax=Pholiota conissans TaxID=109636 RepID=A0A9P5YS81_9AGAR|nr:hypothetical protein BDN70DRAFT_289230 [Pholiota conissans]
MSSRRVRLYFRLRPFPHFPLELGSGLTTTDVSLHGLCRGRPGPVSLHQVATLLCMFRSCLYALHSSHDSSSRTREEEILGKGAGLRDGGRGDQVLLCGAGGLYPFAWSLETGSTFPLAARSAHFKRSTDCRQPFTRPSRTSPSTPFAASTSTSSQVQAPIICVINTSSSRTHRPSFVAIFVDTVVEPLHHQHRYMLILALAVPRGRCAPFSGEDHSSPNFTNLAHRPSVPVAVQIPRRSKSFVVIFRFRFRYRLRCLSSFTTAHRHLHR